MKTTDHLPTFRKKKQRRKLIRGLIYFSPVVALFLLVTAVYIASYQEQLKQQEKSPSDQNGIIIQAGQREENTAQNDSHKLLPTPLQQNIEEILKDPEAQPVEDNTDIYITERIPDVVDREKDIAAGIEDPDQIDVENLLEDTSRYAIFLIAENGYLTAYSGDRTKVLEHTQIPLGDFPLAQQDMLTRGIYMKTWTDYYDFLETYSS